MKKCLEISEMHNDLNDNVKGLGAGDGKSVNSSHWTFQGVQQEWHYKVVSCLWQLYKASTAGILTLPLEEIILK